MHRSSPGIRRGPLERLWAWLYIGPLGHLYGVAADVSLLFARYGWWRLRGRRT